MRNYRVNEIFYSLQGEGHHTGRPAAFIRFAGCNLRCPFCDTEFDTYKTMTAEDIITTILPYPTRFVVLTGGEPTLQADEAFVDLLHQHGYEVAMESNGTRPAPRNLDWLTVSPKKSGERREERGERNVYSGERREERGERLPDEVKIVFEENTDPEAILSPLSSLLSPLKSTLLSPLKSSLLSPLKSPLLYLQPCDTGDAERNAQITKKCIDYIKEHPQWRLSLQTHKLLGIR